MGKICASIWNFYEIEIFVDKYLTIDEIILPKDIRNVQIHQHK
jgi:hypothetical protein